MAAETLIIWLIVGAFIGGWLFPQWGISTGGGILGEILGATVGAIVLLLTLGLVRRSA